MLQYDSWPPEKGKIHYATVAGLDDAQDMGIYSSMRGEIEAGGKRYPQSFFLIGVELAANLPGSTPVKVLDIAQSIDFQGWNEDLDTFEDAATRVTTDLELLPAWEAVLAGAASHIRSQGVLERAAA